MSQNLFATPKNKQKRNSEIEMGVQCCLYWTYFASRSFFLWAFCKHYSLPGHFAVQRILVGKLVGIQEDLGKFTINRWFSHSWCLPADFQKKNHWGICYCNDPCTEDDRITLQLGWVGAWMIVIFPPRIFRRKKGKSESQHKVRVCTAPTRAGIQKK